ncbi:condensation domain-containing protein, partial [Streptomyces yanii]
VALVGHPLVRGAAVLVQGEAASRRLVAYVVSDGPVDSGELRAFLGERLPGHMVPGVFVPLEVLPLSPNGKVDRGALGALPWMDHAVDGRDFVAPRSEVEERLAGIWESVLGTGRPVGVHDDFFSLGGDSILSLQVIFRAKQCGLFFTVKQLFEFQTIAELALVVERQDAAPVRAEQGLVTGAVELTPVQRWFFEQEFVAAQHVNQSVLTEVDPGLSSGQWERVVGCLLEQHDGLRTRFVREGDGWRAEVAGVPEAVPWQVHDLSSCPSGEWEERLREIAGRVQAGLSLSDGPLFCAVLFTGVPGRADRLLLVAHHLVVDVVSWRILLEDLQVLVGLVRQGREPVLPAKSSSWQQWAGRLCQEALSASTVGEVSYWSEQAGAVGELPLDGRGAGGNTVGGSRVLRAVLGAGETRALLRDVPAVFNSRVNDVLLTGVAAAVGAWTGDGHVRVDVEGHGREDLFGDLDVSRTT